jgi:hypothetical protein
LIALGSAVKLFSKVEKDMKRENILELTCPECGNVDKWNRIDCLVCDTVACSACYFLVPNPEFMKCNVRWNEALSYQDKNMFFENEEQYKKFLKKYEIALRFIGHASNHHPDGTVTVTI